MGERAEALQTAHGWRRRGALWTDGSRRDSGGVGAACVWRTPEGWTARRYHLGTNKGVFGTEVYAIYRALRILNQRQESGHRYVIFVDSTSIIERIRTDAFGPGQRFDIATMEVCSRILARENKVMVRWVPAHYELAGN